MRTERAAEPLAIGTLFADRYMIEEILGRGGMGQVYRARDWAVGEDIALKLLSREMSETPAAVVRFRAEVRLSWRVTHPNVARVFDIGEHEGIIFLTMELIRGATLRESIGRGRRFPLERALGTARSLCAALRAAHAAGVVHRDLKPSNVMVEPGGRVVVTDFGIARSLSEESGLTVGAIGTPRYMAPEQASGGSIDARTDLYALGILLFEMLAGELPPRAEDVEARLARGDVRAPPAIARMVRSCLEIDAAMRPATASEVDRVLAAALGAAPCDGAAPASLAASAARPSAADSPPRGPTSLGSRSVPGAPTLLDGRGLAVLPFRYRGAVDHAFLADGVTEELVDVLARTRGVRILGAGATARYREQRDPQAIGREAGVVAVVDGTVQLAAGRVRTSVRLLDANTGEQLWSERYDGAVGDLFDLPECIARRVAEELRLELTTRSHRGEASAEAVEHYLAARALARTAEGSPIEMVEAFGRSIALAPGFAPALAGHAMASVRRWFFRGEGADAFWESAAKVSVARAVEQASDLAETHLAAAMLAAQYGDYRKAAQALARALQIAPTMAGANEYLGMLECEAGRAELGAVRLALAHELDPRAISCMTILARHHHLNGRPEACEQLLVEAEREAGPAHPRVVGQRIRSAAWQRDHAGLRRWVAMHHAPEAPAWTAAMTLYARAQLGELSGEELSRDFAPLLGASNPRWRTLLSQVLVEVDGSWGRLDAAFARLVGCASDVLVDVEWLDLCPLLGGVREHPQFSVVRQVVAARAAAIWAR